MLDSLNRSSNSPLLSENVPLLTSDQPLQPQPNTLQSFMCNNVLNQPSQSPTIVSLLQGNIQTDMNDIQPNQASLASSLNMNTAHHQLKQNRTNQFFPQQTFSSKSFEEPHFSQQPLAQANAPVQVPLQNMPQRHVASSTIPISDTNEKNAKHPLFFSVSLGQLNQSMNPSGNYKVPTQTTTGTIFQPSVQQTAVTNAETPFRRHSYTTGQKVHPVQSGSGDYMGSRRSRPIVPAATTKTFAVPEIPVSLFLNLFSFYDIFLLILSITYQYLCIFLSIFGTF